MPLKILIAEDSATNRLLLSMAMTRMGHQADIVANGREAVDFFTDNIYDLVFLDLHMPVMNGIETAYNIRRHNPRGIPVYAISGLPPEEMVARFQEVGIRRCLIKPLDRAKLDEIVRECGFGPQDSAAPPPEDAPSRVPARLMKTYAQELRSRGQACLDFYRAGDTISLIREAHTIRALAVMLKLKDLEQTAHGLELGCEQRGLTDAQVEAAAGACARAAENIERHMRQEAAGK